MPCRLLRALLLERKHWQTMAKTCTFNPNVAIRWIAGVDTTSVILCHGCGDMLGWRDSVRFSGHFDPAEAELLAFDRGVFPDDSILAEIAARKAARPR